MPALEQGQQLAVTRRTLVSMLTRQRVVRTHREHLLKTVILRPEEVLLSRDMPRSHAQRVNISTCKPHLFRSHCA